MRTARNRIRIPRPKRPVPQSAPALEWIDDLSGRSARVTAIGSRRLLIENHTGIIDFTCELVRLSTVRGPIRIEGSDLALCEVRKGALIVQGCICQVMLPQEGGPQ